MTYPTDLSDEEFRHIEPHLPAANQWGRPRIHAAREILNALFYVLKCGCPWRLLPREFPPWSVYHWFRAWRIDGTWECLNAALRARLGRNPQRDHSGLPDDQGVEGRKRHLLVDTEGLVLKVRVHSARVPDADGIRLLLLEPLRGRFASLCASVAVVGRCRLPGEGQEVG